MVEEKNINSIKKSKDLIDLLNEETDLNDNSLIELKIPDDFEQITINLDKNNYFSQIKKIVNPILEKVEKLGYQMNIFTALYEGILNGFQHGNKYDSLKKLIIASKITPENLEFIISDQGDTIHSEFSKFILEQRKKDRSESFIDWYEFSNQEKPQTNNGTGTSFIHAYMDEVKYFKSLELGGLSLYLSKKNN